MRVVLFDVDGVLLHDPAAALTDGTVHYTWKTHLAADFGFGPDALRPFFRDQFPDVVTGRQDLVNALGTVLPTIGYHGSPLNLIAYWLKNDTHPHLGLVDKIRALSHTGAVRLFLATNQEHLRALHLWRDLGLSYLFEDILYSARLGVAKPDPAFFQAVDALIGPYGEPPLFFDDNAENVAAAISHGWEAARFTKLEHFTAHPVIAGLLGHPA